MGPAQVDTRIGFIIMSFVNLSEIVVSFHLYPRVRMCVRGYHRLARLTFRRHDASELENSFCSWSTFVAFLNSSRIITRTSRHVSKNFQISIIIFRTILWYIKYIDKTKVPTCISLLLFSILFFFLSVYLSPFPFRSLNHSCRTHANVKHFKGMRQHRNF